MRVHFLTSVVSGPGGTYREGEEQDIAEAVAAGWIRAGWVIPVRDAVVEAAVPARGEMAEKAVRPIRSGRQERHA